MNKEDKSFIPRPCDPIDDILFKYEHRIERMHEKLLDETEKMLNRKFGTSQEIIEFVQTEKFWQLWWNKIPWGWVIAYSTTIAVILLYIKIYKS